MKSKIIKLYDYKQVELPKEVYIEGVKERINREINALRKKFKKVEIVDSVEKGDVITLNLKSNISKYNRTGLKLNVGSNLFDKEFEKQLVGLKVGEDALLKAGGENVEVRVTESKRSIYPELTDEIVAEGMMREEYNEPDIKTVEQYLPRLHDDVFEVLSDEWLSDESERLMNEVASKSEILYDDEEISSMLDEQLEAIEEELKEEGKSLDTISEQVYRTSFSSLGKSVNSKETLKEALVDLLKQSVVAKAVSCELDGKDFEGLPFEEIEETAWEVFYNHIKENVILKEKED